MCISVCLIVLVCVCVCVYSEFECIGMYWCVSV